MNETIEALEVSVSAMRDTKFHLMNTIASLVKSALNKEVYLRVGKGVIWYEDTTVVEVKEGVVYSYSSQLPLKVTQRIALGKLTDTLQFVVSEIDRLTVELTEEVQKEFKKHV